MWDLWDERTRAHRKSAPPSLSKQTNRSYSHNPGNNSPATGVRVPSTTPKVQRPQTQSSRPRDRTSEASRSKTTKTRARWGGVEKGRRESDARIALRVVTRPSKVSTNPTKATTQVSIRHEIAGINARNNQIRRESKLKEETEIIAKGSATSNSKYLVCTQRWKNSCVPRCRNAQPGSAIEES